MQGLAQWHQTKKGLSVFAIVELAAAYGAASWAIDNGNLLLYLAAILLLIGFIQNLVRLIKKFSHGNKQKAKRAK